MSTTATESKQSTATSWRLDPANSAVEFEAKTFWGLVTVKGHFNDYQGVLTLGPKPDVALTVAAASLDTGNRKRDEHLRSEEFFDAERHPQVSFVSDDVKLDGERLQISGVLHAAGRQLPIKLEAKLNKTYDGYEIEAATPADHRALGMTWSPLGMLRTTSKLSVRGRLIK
jgi:polyisoprenoid-binding protein YceI